jgi:TolC family type I secretion outer membrane protein
MTRPRLLFLILFFMIICLHEALAEDALLWKDCLTEAGKNNPDLISALENVHQQEAGKAIKQSGYYPQIIASADASTSKQEDSKKTKSYSMGVSGTQLIFDGFKTSNQVNAASENIKAAQQNYRFASSTVRFNLRTAFVNLLKAQELIRVDEEIFKIRRDNLELITLRYQSGLEHKGALLTAEANIAAANFSLSQTKRSIASSWQQLNKVMGRKEFKPLKVRAEFVVLDSAKEKPDLEALAKNHPTILQATARKNLASFDVKSVYADYYPAFSASAGADKSDVKWPPNKDRWNAGLSVSMPLFEGGLRSAQVSQAMAALRQAEADERSAIDTVIVSLQTNWAALQDAIETVEVRRKSLEAAEERAKIAEAQYSIGFITFDNWIIIQNDLVSAKQAYLEAQANALLAEASWVQAKGETLEYAS